MQKLTKSEQEVALLVMQGLTNKEIALKRFISVHTVKSQLECIYEKLGITNRVLLAVYICNTLKKETIN